MPDTIEYYNYDGIEGRNLIASIKSLMVPTVGSFISIRKETWEVIKITYALDDADNWQRSNMRANVDLRRTSSND